MLNKKTIIEPEMFNVSKEQLIQLIKFSDSCNNDQMCIHYMPIEQRVNAFFSKVDFQVIKL